MQEIRLLSKEDIDVRVAQTQDYNGKVKVTLLLYKNARVDMKIMDELYTPMGWRRTHKLIGDRLYCQVDVWDEVKKEWITKEDVGVESNTEAEKGQASDSFKRACVNWGIGRELYTAPRVSVELEDKEFTKDQSGRIKVWATFQVAEIGYDKASRTITSLTIVDRFGRPRFTMEPVEVKEEVKTEPSPAVKARREAKKKKTDPFEPSPVEQKKTEETEQMKSMKSGEMYWKIVAAFATGKQTKTGGSYRDTWITTTNASDEEIRQFDLDVQNYQYVNSF